MALLAAVALHEAVSLHADGVGVKWPNDLTADGAKLAGILLERELDAVIVGFGANLAHHPDLPDRVVTSLKALTGAAPEPGIFAETLAEIFARWFARWRNEGHASIRARWLEAAHPLGTLLSTPDGEGLFDGLDETGALKLKLADGSSRLVHAGDVFML